MYWIEDRFPGRIAIVPRPRGGDWLERDLALLRKSGIDLLVSLLTPEESEHFELLDLAQSSRAAGIEYESFPIPDRSVPSSVEEFGDLANRLASKLSLGQNVAVHCRQGIGRSSLLTAAVLTAAGIEPATAMKNVSAARGLSVPETAEQRHWFDEFARRQPAAFTR